MVDFNKVVAYNENCMKTFYNGKNNLFQQRKIVFFVVLSLLFSSKNAFCEEGDTLQHFALDTLIVCAIKHSSNQWMLPIAATTISKEVIQQTQVFEMKDFTASIPNFMMVDRDTKRTSSVFVRGIGNLINTPGVAMYVDGIPHFEKASFDIHLTDIERIEFLRGPQGTLYGRNAMGGIILVHTKSPFLHQGTQLNLRYGSYHDAYVSASHLEKINDHFAYRVSVDYDYFGGFIQNTFLKEKADRMKSGSINSRLAWRPGNNLSIRLINSVEKVHQGAFSYGDVNTHGYVDSVSTDYNSYYDRTIYDGGVKIDYRHRYFWLQSQTSVQVLRDEYDVDQDISPKNLYTAKQSEDQALISQEINIKGLKTRGYNWSAGLFAFNHNMERNTDVFYNMKTPPHKLEKRYDDFARGFAAYHQSTIYFTPRFKLEAGIRYDYERANSVLKEDIVVSKKTEPGRRYDSPLTFRQWSPKASLQYFFTTHTQVYTTVTKGYKTGGFNTAFKIDKHRAFKPETSWNYEIGAKASLIKNLLNTELALFYIDINNQQIKQSLDKLGLQVINAGTSVSKGFELSMQVLPTRNLSLNFSYGHTHATFKKYVYSANIDYSGKFVPFVPRHTLNVGAQFIVPFVSLASDEIRFNAVYRGIGKIYWHENNMIKQPYYSLLDGSIAIHKNGMIFSVWAKNMTNTKYLGYCFTMRKRQLGKPGRPFTTGISLSLSF